VNANSGPFQLTIDSRRALARRVGMQAASIRILEKHPLLEDATADMADQGLNDDLFRLVARMLAPSVAVFWVVAMCDYRKWPPDDSQVPLKEARVALLNYAHKPTPENLNLAVAKAKALRPSTPLGQAGTALSLIGAGDGNAGGQDLKGVFADLLGRSILLLCQEEPDDLKKQILCKLSAGAGIFLAVNGLPKGWGGQP
jgi:hypothetical protein